MNERPHSVLTWKNLLLHLLAYFTGCFCIGLFMLAPSALLELAHPPFSMGKSGLIPFVLGMSLFMGAFYALFGGLFVLPGLFIGLRYKLYGWWFATVWGGGSALAIARLFHDRSQTLDQRFYLAVALGGCCAGALYWAIAIHHSTKPTRSPIA